MKITSEDQITFDGLIQDKHTYWQDIIFNGEVIGALAQTITGMLDPIQERVQMLVPETEAHHFDGWYHSEDQGKVFGYFDSLDKLDKFISYYNSKID